MYAIVNELGVNKDNLMEYEIFGVKLANTKERKMDLIKLREDLKRRKVNPEEINQTYTGFLLQENARETEIFYGGKNNIDLFNQVKNGKELYNLAKGDSYYNVKGFKAINPVNPDYMLSWVYGAVYDKMLEVALKYFDDSKKSPKRIQIPLAVAAFMELTQALELNIYRLTEPKFLCDKQEKKCNITWNSRFLPLLRANALSLMFLTNKTFYINEQGEEIPIIIGGAERKNIEWKEKSEEEVIDSIRHRVYTR